MPDEYPRRRPEREEGGANRVDLLDGLADFAREFPGWLDGSGKPVTWRAFVIGTRYLARARAREKLRMADATSVVQAKDEQRRRWVRIHELMGDL